MGQEFVDSDKLGYRNNLKEVFFEDMKASTAG